ncbi:hypothetical protein HY988_04810 [Candidatus Micrarchaeota archaeon]|nr:hypothetical protein [Candidatus Micrarchaeota archaeon]
MFGTSGIRGIYGKDVTEDLAKRIANIFSDGKLVVGRDIRASGPSLLKAIFEGATAAGADVIDCGIIPTPTLGLATKKYSCRGIMITASHNPPEYNGLKLVENGKEIGKQMEISITKSYNEKKCRDAKNKGSVYFDDSIIDEHKLAIQKMVDVKAISKKKPKVIVDPNGAGAAITPSLLTDLGCQVISINSTFEKFERESEPNEKNLTHLSQMIRATGADFGIAHDGDCDRCVVVDEQGSVLPLDVQLAMMIEYELDGGKNKNKKIVSTVEASLAVREAVEKFGGTIEITPVGSTIIAERIEEIGAIFGGEPCGEYVYSKSVHLPDAPLAAAKFAEMFCKYGQFSKLKAKYKQYFIAREKFGISNKKNKYEIVEKVKAELATIKPTINGKIRIDDGVRVDEEDGWFLVRASGTEPAVRLTIEYKTQAKLLERKENLTKLIEKMLQSN